MAEVATLLRIEFEAHYSDYWGGDYYSAGIQGGEYIRVLRNGPEDDPEDIPYVEHAAFPVIIEVNCSLHQDDYRARLESAGFTHIARTTT
jgi:hypothetical protein